MPERKRLIGTPREHAQYVADAARLPRQARKKMAPKTGAIRRKYGFRRSGQTKEAISQTLDLPAQSPK
jgi:hypothetical protein